MWIMAITFLSIPFLSSGTKLKCNVIVESYLHFSSALVKIYLTYIGTDVIIKCSGEAIELKV